MFFIPFPWFPLYSINRPVKLTCKFKLSPSFLLCNSWTVCIKIHLIPLWHKHSSHWDLWEKRVTGIEYHSLKENVCPESWVQISSNETITAGNRQIFYEASLQRDSFLIVFMEVERMHTKKDKYLPKRKLLQWRHQQHFTYCTKSWNERQEYAIFLCFQRVRTSR